MNKIQENDLKIIEELCGHNFSCFTFNKIKRYLLSYSLQYDWDFISFIIIIMKNKSIIVNI